MRNAFFALVLANLAFAAWTIWYSAPPTPSTPRETGMPIRLVGEAEADVRLGENVGADESAGSDENVAATRALAATHSSEPDTSEPGTSDPDARVAARDEPDVRAAAASEPDARDAAERCVSIGPFPTEARVEAAAAALGAAGYAFSSRSAEGEIWVGFWVHINAIPTRAEANAMLAELRENGLPDAYLIPGEEDGDIISLGVFNDMTRAGRLEQQVRRIGLEPVIAERSRPGTVHWLDVTVPAGRELDLGTLGIRLDRIEQSRCPSDG